mmetsp:Transcript_14719/g.42118  ORF Transcript_14719/g.42118 Transcript_14719/m.42118 type:complete len:201 (+) Transcript_14719:966-1568(+)
MSTQASLAPFPTRRGPRPPRRTGIWHPRSRCCGHSPSDTSCHRCRRRLPMRRRRAGSSGGNSCRTFDTYCGTPGPAPCSHRRRGRSSRPANPSHHRTSRAWAASDSCPRTQTHPPRARPPARGGPQRPPRSPSRAASCTWACRASPRSSHRPRRGWRCRMRSADSKRACRPTRGPRPPGSSTTAGCAPVAPRSDSQSSGR